VFVNVKHITRVNFSNNEVSAIRSLGLGCTHMSEQMLKIDRRQNKRINRFSCGRIDALNRRLYKRCKSINIYAPNKKHAFGVRDPGSNPL